MKTRLQNTKGSYGDYVGSLEATGRGASEGLTGHLSTHISETSMSVFSFYAEATLWISKGYMKLMQRPLKNAGGAPNRSQQRPGSKDLDATGQLSLVILGSMDRV